MKWLYGASLLAAILACSAQASSFDDFNRGVAARNRGDSDAAIAEFTRALADGDLAQGLQYIALFDRGMAYATKQQFAESIADLSRVITIKPDFFEAYLWRSRLRSTIGQKEASADDCKTMISLKPDARSPYAWCGRLQFEIGQYAQAASTFESALRLTKNPSAYDVLWFDLAKLRAGQSNATEFAQGARSVDVDVWPAPILDYLSGNGTREAVDAAAATGDAQKQRDQKCEVGFYLGEWQMAHNDPAAARPLLQQAVDLCPETFIERKPAEAEWARLNKR